MGTKKDDEHHNFDISGLSYFVQPEGQRHFLVLHLTSDTSGEQLGTVTFDADLNDYVADEELKDHENVELILDEIRKGYGIDQCLTHQV